MGRLFSMLTSLWLAGCSVMGIRSAPEPRYQLLRQDGACEIRLYPPLVLAETWVTADYREAGGIGFTRLAGYIFGGNTRRDSLPMTAPVFRQAASEQIGMTAPVLQQADGQQWRMAFVMPDGYTLDNLPLPMDEQVVLKTLPAQKVAVLRYSGALNAANVTAHSQRLLDWLQQQAIKSLSAPRSAAYDPPWTLPLLRRNEIHIEIE